MVRVEVHLRDTALDKVKKELVLVSRAIDRHHLVMRLLFLRPTLTSHNNITHQQQLKYTANQEAKDILL